MALKATIQKTEFDRLNCRRFKLVLTKSTDADIIEWLDNQKSKQGYICQLVRDDIAKENG